MRRLLLAAAYVAATTTVLAAIPSEVTIDSGTVAGTTGASPEIRVFKGIPGEQRRRSSLLVPTEAATVPAAATLAFFDLGFQQLLKGGANQ